MAPEKYIMRFLLLSDEERARLEEMIPKLLSISAAANNSARMATYAFLDASTGGVEWSKSRDIPPARLRELRAYDLRGPTFREPWHIDARYGAFFGCGDAALLKPVQRLAESPTHQLSGVARWSLDSVRRQHPMADAALRGEA